MMNTTGAAPENGARLLDRFLLPTERRVHYLLGAALRPQRYLRRGER